MLESERFQNFTSLDIAEQRNVESGIKNQFTSCGPSNAAAVPVPP